MIQAGIAAMAGVWLFVYAWEHSTGAAILAAGHLIWLGLERVYRQLKRQNDFQFGRREYSESLCIVDEATAGASDLRPAEKEGR